MARGTRLPILRGRITEVDTYRSPNHGGGQRLVRSVDPAHHSLILTQQLDAITQQVRARAEGARDALAEREIVVVRPASGERLLAEPLADARSDARLVGIVPDSGTVVLDVANAELDYLRKKIDAFADDTEGAPE